MTSRELLRPTSDARRGFLPQSIGETSLDPKGFLRRLKKIPHKITAHFHRRLIEEVYRSDHAARDEDNYYIIVTTDGTKFHIEY